MEAANKDNPTAIVIGSGISGEVAALKLAEAGYAVTINEGASRVGGKIASQTLNGQSVDLGAEFVDADHKGLRDLCTKYGIQLKDATDQNHEEYVLPNGKRISGEKFSKAAESVQQRIIADNNSSRRTRSATAPSSLTACRSNNICSRSAGQSRRPKSLPAS